ncbi:MAG: outer membrane beta-barrel protein [Deltaproteobacteria bacterium]|nr:outer membrane beta-barrel protein [Deltaproteobacteria bacterium]
MRAFIMTGILTSICLSSGSARADRLQQPGSFGLGVRTSGLQVAPEGSPDTTMQLQGGGFHVRYRWLPRWSFELSIEGLHGEAKNESFTRESLPVTVSAAYHVTPYGPLDLYLLFGLGGTQDEVTYKKADGTLATESFQEDHVHLGVGAEWHFGRWGVNAELRGVGLTRSDTAMDGARYAGLASGPVPKDSSGAQGNLGLTYYF